MDTNPTNPTNENQDTVSSDVSISSEKKKDQEELAKPDVTVKTEVEPSPGPTIKAEEKQKPNETGNDDRKGLKIQELSDIGKLIAMIFNMLFAGLGAGARLAAGGTAWAAGKVLGKENWCQEGVEFIKSIPREFFSSALDSMAEEVKPLEPKAATDKKKEEGKEKEKDNVKEKEKAEPKDAQNKPAAKASPTEASTPVPTPNSQARKVADAKEQLAAEQQNPGTAVKAPPGQAAAVASPPNPTSSIAEDKLKALTPTPPAVNAKNFSQTEDHAVHGPHHNTL